MSIVSDVNPFAPSSNVKTRWTLRKATVPRRWAPDLGNGTYVKEARNHQGLLCFVVKFPNGRECTQDTLAAAMDYAEQHANENFN
jgi:hypothetical protein